ncbi:hypothetical protein AALB39_18025 [Lachnospiraceae bacterium 54-53]
MGAKKLYNVYDQGCFIGKYTSREASQLLGISKDSLYQSVELGSIVAGRYTFEDAGRFKEAGAWAKQWDEARMKIKKSGNSSIEVTIKAEVSSDRMSEAELRDCLLKTVCECLAEPVDIGISFRVKEVCPKPEQVEKEGSL